MITNEQLLLLEKYLKESNNIVFFGGAGVSTESGIPDFRSKDGLYNNMGVDFSKYKPEYLLALLVYITNLMYSLSFTGRKWTLETISLILRIMY